MMKKFLSKKVAIEVFLILFLGLTPLLWYQPGSLVFGHDTGFPLDPIGHFQDRLFAWTERLGLGLDQSMSFGAFFIHGFEALIKWLGFSLQSTQKITFVFWFVTPGLAMYYFVYSLKLQKKLPFLGLIASIFYMFNHFLLQGWFIAERTKFSIIVALPLVLSFFIRGLQQKISLLKAAILINLVLFFFNGGGGLGLPLYGGLGIGLGVYSVYFILLSWRQTGIKSLKRPFFLTILGLFLFVVLNAYWLLPFANFVSRSYAPGLAATGGAAGVLNWIMEISRHTSFSNLLRLQGIPDWYGNPNHPYANLFLENPLLIMASFVWPLLAFGGLIMARRRSEKRLVLFFVLLALISAVFAAGTHPPTGAVYEAMVKNVPFFAIFRTPFYKFGYGLWFAYAFLISFSVNKLLVKFKKKWIAGSLTFLFMALILLYNYPFFTGSFFNWKPPLSTMVRVPGYVFEFGQWASSLEKEERVLMLPPLNKDWQADAYSWRYWGLSSVPSLLTRKSVVANTPELNQTQAGLLNNLYLALWEKDGDMVKKIASILNIKYFLLRQDVIFDLDWCSTVSPSQISQRLKDFDWIKKERQFGEWLVYRLETDEFLPRFFISRKFSHVQDDGGDLAEVISSLEDGKLAREVFFTEIANSQEKADSFLAIGKCSGCNPLEKTRVKLPYIRFLPNSVLYSLIEWKEANWEKKVRANNDPVQIIDLNLGLATKRLAELQRLVNEEKDEETLKETVRAIMEEYQARVEEISDQLEEMEKADRDVVEILLRARDYYEKHKEVFAEIRHRRFDEEIKIQLENGAWALDDFLVKDLSRQLISDEQAKRYTFEILAEGEYDFLVKNEAVADYFIQNPLDPVVFELDGKVASSSGERQDGYWLSVARVNLLPGKHRLALTLPEAKNLVEKVDMLLEQAEAGRKTVSLPINNFDNQGVFEISFDYRVLRGQPAKVVIIQDIDQKTIYPDNDVFPRTLKYFLQPKFEAKKARLEFILEADEKKKEITGEKGKSVFEVKNIQVKRVWNPKVILKMVSDETREVETKLTEPKITIEKINPTKYEIDVEGAEKPYNLIFNESFHPSWQATVASDVGSFFESWGQAKLDKPLLANGHVNSWYITPEDSGGRQNYRLIIEFWPQRLFYIGIVVSILGLVGCFLAFFLVRREP